MSATVIDQRQIEASGARRLADLTRFDASVSDAYNAPGYWDFLSIRGFTLDNRFNYRREGLPISAETTIPLDNKERIEILKGTSGIQAGTSAPGGLVNYVVKRPTEQDLRQVKLEAGSRANLLAAADLGGRFGDGRAFGYRLNVAQERLRPLVRNLDGERSLVALATDWRVTRDSVLEGEFEWSQQVPAQPGRLQLAGQHAAGAGRSAPQSQQPTLVASLGVRRHHGHPALHAGAGRATGAGRRNWARSGSKSDDFTAFPFGCGAEGNFDRFCSDGTFDFYDFRSENERRRQDAASLNLKGKLATGGVSHDLSFGLLAGKRAQPLPAAGLQLRAGTGNVRRHGRRSRRPDARPRWYRTATNARSNSSSHDAIRWNERLTTWVGTAPHAARSRELRPTAPPLLPDLTTPWLAASYKLGADMTAYASCGEGVESQQRAQQRAACTPIRAKRCRR